MSAGPSITRALASFAFASRFETLPEAVQGEAVRAFLNWLGCSFGGSPELASVRAASVLGQRRSGVAQLIGHGLLSDVAGAAFVNCLSSSALAFDDTHLATITHPTGPVAAALLAFSETTEVSGAELLNALAVGIEIQCRLSSAILLPPAQPNHALYITGITGPVGAAAALARLAGLDEQGVLSAMGLAASQAAGLRATHGSSAGIMVPAFGARAAVFAVDLARAAMDCSGDILEAPNGLIGVFSPGADPETAIYGLGSQFEMLANAYKPYPAGIVLHAAIDACREVASRIPDGVQVARAQLRVNPVALALADRPAPASAFEAQISLQHWAASMLLYRKAGIEVLQADMLCDRDTASLRERISVRPDETLARDEACVQVGLADGATIEAHVLHARGSLNRPMTDAELDEKFMHQVLRVAGEPSARAILAATRNLAGCSDVGRTLGSLIAGAGQADILG